MSPNAAAKVPPVPRLEGEDIYVWFSRSIAAASRREAPRCARRAARIKARRAGGRS